MGMLKSTVRTQLRTGERLDGLRNTANTVLFDSKSPTMFATFAGVQYDGSPTLRFTVAGHLPILHYHAARQRSPNGQRPKCRSRCSAIGYLPPRCVACDPGDLLVILTDGLTEVFDRADREFGMQRVKTLIQGHAIAPLATIENRVFAAIRAHGAQLDDQTLLLIRVLP